MKNLKKGFMTALYVAMLVLIAPILIVGVIVALILACILYIFEELTDTYEE